MNWSLKTIGVILLSPFSFLGNVLNQILLSPWGLMIPLTLLIVLFAFQQVQKTPDQLALYYAEQLESAHEDELPVLLETLVRMGDSGVTGLVSGLTAKREDVFSACLKVLHCEFDHWTQSSDRERRYLIFSQALLDASPQFSPVAQSEAMKFVDQIIQIRSDTANDPPSTMDRQKTLRLCEQLLSQLESARRRRLEPTHEEFAPVAETAALLHQRTDLPALYASNGKPFLPTSARENMKETALAQAAKGADYNALSAARADRLAAHQKTQQNRPKEDWGNPHLAEYQAESLLADFSSPPSFAAGAESKFAQQFTGWEDTSERTDSSDDRDISEDYRNQIQSMPNVISPELQNMPLDKVPHVPTTQLMQLLHHSDPAYVDLAQKTLISRDGFQETHMKLAYRLFHPVPAVRQEIIDILPSTPNVQASVWMTVLLHDPNNDVRYRAASFLATATNPALRQLLIERGKHDHDARIVNLADRLNNANQENSRKY